MAASDWAWNVTTWVASPNYYYDATSPSIGISPNWMSCTGGNVSNVSISCTHGWSQCYSTGTRYNIVNSETTCPLSFAWLTNIYSTPITVTWTAWTDNSLKVCYGASDGLGNNTIAESAIYYIDKVWPTVPVQSYPATWASFTSMPTVIWQPSTDVWCNATIQWYGIGLYSNSLCTTPLQENSVIWSVTGHTFGAQPNGTYYWHVFAYDGLWNQSSWSPCRSFIIAPSDSTPPTVWQSLIYAWNTYGSYYNWTVSIRATATDASWISGSTCQYTINWW
jgi:hypothetical protein